MMFDLTCVPRRLIAFVALALLTSGCAEERRFDILIQNGQVVDGSGDASFNADVGILGNSVAAVGDLSGASAGRVIDATGLVVAPGFIDMHTHVDDGFADPVLSTSLNYLIQGVTTVRPGADGFGPLDFAEAQRVWEANGMGTNAVPFAAYTAIRYAVMGEDQLRAPTADEMTAMQTRIREAMDYGAWDISAQLEYDGRETHLSTDEMVEAASVVRDYDGLYIAHIRDEASRFIDAVDETIEIGERAGIPVQITHIKVTGRSNWGTMATAIERINAARERGVAITADQYPFLQGAPIDYITSLVDVPQDVQPLYDLAGAVAEVDVAVEGQAQARQRYVQALQAALQDEELRERLRCSTYEKRPGNPSAVARWGWQDFRIKVAVENAEVLEKNIAELIDEQGRDGFDIVADLILSEPDILFAAASQSPEDMRLAMVEPWVMISSDGLNLPATAEGEAPTRAHPRSFASQAIALCRFVREEKLLTLEDAVRKMTSLPAQVLSLSDRGLIRAGMVADIAVFDAERIQDHATYADARRYATGVEFVLVGGQIAVENGEFNGARAGRVLLKH